MKYNQFRHFLIILLFAVCLHHPILAQSTNLVDSDVITKRIEQILHRLDRIGFVTIDEKKLSVERKSNEYQVTIPDIRLIAPTYTHEIFPIQLALRPIIGRDWSFTADLPSQFDGIQRQGKKNITTTLSGRQLDGNIDGEIPILREIRLDLSNLSRSSQSVRQLTLDQLSGGFKRQPSAGNHWLTKGRLQLSNLNIQDQSSLNSARLETQSFQRFEPPMIHGGQSTDTAELITDRTQIRLILGGLTLNAFGAPLDSGQLIQKLSIKKQNDAIRHDLFFRGDDIISKNKNLKPFSPADYRSNITIISRPDMSINDGTINELDLMTDWLLTPKKQFFTTSHEIIIDHLTIDTPVSAFTLSGTLSTKSDNGWPTGKLTLDISDLGGFLDNQRKIAKSTGINIDFGQLIERRKNRGQLMININSDGAVKINGVKAASLPPVNR